MLVRVVQRSLFRAGAAVTRAQWVSRSDGKSMSLDALTDDLNPTTQESNK